MPTVSTDSDGRGFTGGYRYQEGLEEAQGSEEGGKASKTNFQCLSEHFKKTEGEEIDQLRSTIYRHSINVPKTLRETRL